MYRNIASGQFSIPPHVSAEAASLIQGLLSREPMQRTGVAGRGFQGVKQHPWFQGVRWDAVATLQAPVPRELQVRGAIGEGGSGPRQGSMRTRFLSPCWLQPGSASACVPLFRT